MQNMESEVLSLHTALPVTRRGFLVSSLGVGFAASVLPVSAQTITTDTENIKTAEVKIPVADGQMPAYVAQPAQRNAAPVVLVVQEIFGVHEYIKDVCRRFAKAGYMAIAPELFARQGDPRQYTVNTDIVTNIVSKVPDAQVMADLDACVAWAGKQGGNAKKLAVTGFCWGGRITWLYSAYNPAVRAGVAWYGRLVGQSSALTPKHPLELVTQLQAPVLGLYGGQDAGIPVSTVAQMQEALQQAKGRAAASKFILYKDAPHAFHADYRPSYRKEAAQDGWQQLLAWFKQHGVA